MGKMNEKIEFATCSSQVTSAKLLCEQKKVTLVSERGVFLVEGGRDRKYCVTLFPKEMCQCPSTTTCYHIIAARFAIGMDDLKSRGQKNVTRLFHKSRKRADRRIGCKKPNKKDFVSTDGIVGRSSPAGGAPVLLKSNTEESSAPVEKKAKGMSPMPTTNCEPKLTSAQRSLFSALTSPLQEFSPQLSPVHGVYDMLANEDQYLKGVSSKRTKKTAYGANSDGGGDTDEEKEHLEETRHEKGSKAQNMDDIELILTHNDDRTEQAAQGGNKKETGDEEELSVLKRRGQRRGRRDQTVSEFAPVIEKNNENEEPVYCVCKKESNGRMMIACDSTKCGIEWFHFKCVGLKSKPQGSWFCPSCLLDNKPQSPGLVIVDSVSTHSPKRFKFRPISTDWMNEKCAEFKLPLHLRRRKQRTIAMKTVLDSPPQKNMVKVTGDGNCLFRTLSHVICGMEEYHSNIRILLCDHIRKKKEEGSGDNYLSKSRMESNFVWGTDVEIQAAADLLHTTIWVYGPQVGRRAWMEFVPEVNKNNEAIFIVNRNYHFEPLYSWL